MLIIKVLLRNGPNGSRHRRFWNLRAKPRSVGGGSGASSSVTPPSMPRAVPAHESDGQLLSWSKVVGRARSANSLFKPIGAALGRFTKACALRPQTRFAAFRFSATNLERLLHTPRATRRLVVNPAAFSRHRNFKVNDGNCAELTANSFSGGCWRISTPKIRNVRNRFPSQRFLATPEVRIHPAPPDSQHNRWRPETAPS
jgi:hypothetical protein